MVLACPWVHALISDGRSNAGLPLVGAALAGGTQLPCPEHVRCVVMVLQFLTCAEFSQFACALLDVRRTHHGQPLSWARAVICFRLNFRFMSFARGVMDGIRDAARWTILIKSCLSCQLSLPLPRPLSHPHGVMLFVWT